MHHPPSRYLHHASWNKVHTNTSSIASSQKPHAATLHYPVAMSGIEQPIMAAPL